VKRSAFVLILATGLASPGFAQHVSVEYGHQVKFSKYATYEWGHNEGELPDQWEDRHIKDKIDCILASKGLREVDSGPADLLVTYQATTRTRVQRVYEDPDWGWGMGWGWGWGDMGPAYSTSTIDSVRKGDLLIDIADPSTKQIVFRAYATGAFRRDPIKEDKRLSKALEKIFKKFPPKG
jgi:hypothetical protein